MGVTVDLFFQDTHLLHAAIKKKNRSKHLHRDIPFISDININPVEMSCALIGTGVQMKLEI